MKMAPVCILSNILKIDLNKKWQIIRTVQNSEDHETFAANFLVERDQIEQQRHYAKLIFLSYRFSQGAIGTQNRLLRYVADTFHSDLFDQAQQEPFQTLTRRMIGNYFLNPSLHPASGVAPDQELSSSVTKTTSMVDEELTRLFESFTNTQLADFRSTLPDIAQSIILNDALYLKRAGGRSGNSSQLGIVVDTYKRDPYDSFFVRFCLHESSKTDEFDAILHQLTSSQNLLQLDTFALRQLQFVLTSYIEHHPDASEVASLLAWCASQDGVANYVPPGSSVNQTMPATVIPMPYGNLFRRFEELSAMAQGTGSDDQIFNIRILMERYGVDLVAFYYENQALCHKIFQVLSELSVGSQDWNKLEPFLWQAYALLEAKGGNSQFANLL